MCVCVLAGVRGKQIICENRGGTCISEPDRPCPLCPCVRARACVCVCMYACMCACVHACLCSDCRPCSERAHDDDSLQDRRAATQSVLRKQSTLLRRGFAAVESDGAAGRATCVYPGRTSKAVSWLVGGSKSKKAPSPLGFRYWPMSPWASTVL